MFNFHNALTAFHNEKVTLPLSLRTEMKKRRNSNRTRLDKGLKENKKPLPFKKVTQGSYVMKTMIRDADNDYDIDDGIYFKKSQLKTQLGIDMSALDVRKMICKTLSEDNRFKYHAEVRNHCVRVNYNSGYHVDIPIYKTDEDGSNPQLASSKWMPSNAEDVSSWFDEQNQSNSPDKENGRQLRRTVRLLKKFAKSRDSWKGSLPSGFALTILVCEQFHPCLGRDDISLHKTMHKIYQRLCGDLEIRHPTTCSALVNSGSEDAKTKKLRDRISENLNNLQLEDCSKEKVATAWNTVFNTDFFVEYVSRSTLFERLKIMATEQTPAEFAKIMAELQKNLEAMRAADEPRFAALEKVQSTKKYDGKIADLNSKIADLNSKMEVYDKLNEQWAKQSDVDKQIEDLKNQYDGRIDELTAALKRAGLAK